MGTCPGDYGTSQKEEVVFKPTKLAKQYKLEKEVAEFFFTSFPYITRLYPVSTHKAAMSNIIRKNSKETKLRYY